MSKILAVLGATGQQGGSVVNFVLNDPELSLKYKIRAITRDVDSEEAKRLKEKVEVVQGDVLDRASLETAFTGVHTIFAMTKPSSFAPDALEIEYNSGKTTADAAVKEGVEYIIFSTLPAVTEISGGKYTNIAPFDNKARIEHYIRSLPVKSAFCSLGWFMQNFHTHTFLSPRQAPDGTWILARHISPKTQMPYIDAVENTGNFVGAILADPDKYEGKTFCAATRHYSLEELTASVSKATGNTVVYKQITPEDFKQNLSVLGADLAEKWVEMFSYQEEFGYFGPDSEKLVSWAAENARGKLTTFEEYLEAHPLKLA